MFVPRRVVSSLLIPVFLALAVMCEAQTFRGGISGRVVDTSGGVLPGVTVTATNAGTAVARTTTTSDTGDFSIPDLALGPYDVEATLQGFQGQKVRVEVSVSRISNIEIKLSVSAVAETIQVSASAVTVDTVSTALSAVIQPKQVQDLPLNGRDFTRMLQLAPGVANNSVNGVRTRGNNYQIDGADNNDAFQNIAAVNQGGVSGIAGTLLPIEAIDQFSISSGGQAEMGRNAGSTVNLVIKSGTNNVNGSVYLLQPARGARGELAGGRSGHADAEDSKQSGRLLARRAHRPGQDVLLLDGRDSGSDRRELRGDDGAVTSVGQPGHTAAESVRCPGQSGVDEPAHALAGGEPDRAGDGAELDWRRPEYLRQLQRHREDRSHLQSGATAFPDATLAAVATRSPAPVRTAPTSSRCRAGCTTSRSCRPRSSPRTW